MIPYELLNTETEYGGHKYFGKKFPNTGNRKNIPTLKNAKSIRHNDKFKE